MKRIGFILILVAMSFAFFGCGDGNSPLSEGDDNSKGESRGKEDKGYEVINDFEDYHTGVEPLILLNNFGKAEHNRDKEFVKSGKYSLKMIPSGCREEGNYSPTLKQPMQIFGNGKDFRDLSSVIMITTAVYNSEAYDVPVKVQLQFFGGYTFGSQEYNLTNGWNTIVYNVDPQMADMSFDVHNCKGILYEFNMPEEDKVPTLYMDDIRIYHTDKPFTPIEQALDEGEICSFDKLYQEYVIVAERRYPEFSPRLSINGDQRFAKKGKSLKVEMPKNDGRFEGYTYTGFTFNADYIHGVGLGKYDENKYFSFWIYNSGNSSQRLFMQCFNYSGDTYYKKTDIYVPAGKWENVRIKLLDMSKGITSNSTGNAGEIYISWEINSLKEDRVIYFDSFEICDGEQ